MTFKVSRLRQHLGSTFHLLWRIKMRRNIRTPTILRLADREKASQWLWMISLADLMWIRPMRVLMQRATIKEHRFLLKAARHKSSNTSKSQRQVQYLMHRMTGSVRFTRTLALTRAKQAPLDTCSDRAKRQAMQGTFCPLRPMKNQITRKMMRREITRNSA